MLVEWLLGKQGQVFEYKMEKFLYALELLGNPQLSLPVIHVAGTNGKGSTIAFLSQLGLEHGLRVGSFVSPHLVSVEDRIRVNQVPISSLDFWQLAQEVRQLEEQVKQVYEPFSYFETVTLIMFLQFSRMELDLALIEVGIGGLQDVTNVVNPLVSVISSIGLDHQELLGNGLAEIAFQKAGIIKKDRPVILGPLLPEAERVCLEEAWQKKAPVLAYGLDFVVEQGQFKNGQQAINMGNIGLAGQHQLENAAVALVAFEAFCAQTQRVMDSDLAQQALARTRWPGRLERVHERPAIYLDGAHNVPAIERLIDYIKKENLQKSTILFAALERKDHVAMLDLLQKSLPEAKIYLAQFTGGAYESSQMPAGELFVADYRVFLEEWRRTASDDAVLFVTGSLYFISDVRAYLLQG